MCAGIFIKLNEDWKETIYACSPRSDGTPASSQWGIWFSRLGVPVMHPSGNGQNGGNRRPSIPNYMNKGAILPLSDGLVWSMWVSLYWMFHDKLFYRRIVVNAIISNDVESKSFSESSCEILIEELDSIYSPWWLTFTQQLQQKPSHHVACTTEL